MQSRNPRNTIELNEIFSTHSPPAKFPFDHYTASTSVSDPEVNITMTTIINNLTDQVKFNMGTQFICGKKIPPM